MLKRPILWLILGLSAVCLLCGLLYFLPPVHARLAWRVENLRVAIRRALNPPEQVVFVPQEQIDASVLDAIVQATLGAMTPSPGLDPSLTPTLPGATETPPPSPTPTLTPTPLPEAVALTGIVHEYQKFNNCGPANLAMTLSYWGWPGDQHDTAAVLRVRESDKNVSPHEMVAFVEGQTDFKALARVGGDLETLKRFIAAGFPVLIEKGYDPEHDDWMGHYLTLSGYDDAQAHFISQDSLIMPDLPVPYEVMTERWRDFNHAYILVYPPEREAEVLALLGPQADELANYEYAARQADAETAELSGRDLFFAWFNLGSNRVALGDYAGAAQAYDQAFAVYPAIPEEERPWRALWYMDGPYAAYYHTGRYQDVFELANTTFFALGEYTLEESFYWRGLAKEALGDHNWALFDLRSAVELNPNYAPAQEALASLEAAVP